MLQQWPYNKLLRKITVKWSGFENYLTIPTQS